MRTNPKGLKLSMSPKAARRVLKDISMLTRRRPGSISTQPGMNDHALFLRLINSDTLRQEWLNTITKENSFEQFRVIADIQKMGYDNFKKWLEDQSKKPDPTDPNDPLNQQFFNQQFAMQQGAVTMAVINRAQTIEITQEEREYQKEQLMDQLIIVADGSEWAQEAAEAQNSDAPHTTDSPSRLLSNLATSLKGVDSAAEASDNSKVAEAASELKAFAQEADLGSSREAGSSFAPRPEPPPPQVEEDE